MARTVPGSGAVIEPIFDEVFGVRAIKVTNGGSGYDPADPPRLTITGCGTPEREALLYPIIDADSGRIIHVRVLDRGRGYDPLRLQIVPTSETPNVVNSFDVNRIWQNHPNSATVGTFQNVTDRLRIVSDNHPKPSQYILAERQPGGSDTIVDRTFDQVFIYRGGKDVPNPSARSEQNDKVTGILSNGTLLHTPEWGADGNAPVGFSIDSVKYDYVKSANEYDAVIENGVYYHQSKNVINEFARANGVFDWGGLKQFTWNVKVELDNILISVSNVDETLGSVEVGRLVDEIGGNAAGEVAKIVRNEQNQITKLYIRGVTNTFSDEDVLLGSNGFKVTISDDPIVFTNGIFYIDFGEEAEEFGSFVPGQYYLAPENIQVQRNYLIRWNQSDASNQQGGGHQMQFSTTADGALNGGSLYYNSTGSSAAPSTDYENEYQPLFVMNADENNRIYYHCKNHRYMSGYEGNEGYMVLSSEVEDEDLVNNYYAENYYQSDQNDPNTIDKSRHVDGHSKILGMSFDGYPIYGPYGYTTNRTVGRMVSSYRLRTTNELSGGREEVVTASTVTYAVTVSAGKFLFDASSVEFLELLRGKTYIFNQDDSTNDNNALLISSTDDGWHGADPSIIGNVENLYSGQGISYYLNGSEVTYANYISGFAAASQREIRFEVPVDAPRLLYIFGYSTADLGIRIVQQGYKLGDLTQDYISDYDVPFWSYLQSYATTQKVQTSAGQVYRATTSISPPLNDDGVPDENDPGPIHTGQTTVDGWEHIGFVGTLDTHNGKFGVTPEYPNGTYAYFMTETSTGEPQYPYAIGPKYYGVPLFEGDAVPEIASDFPTETAGDIVLNDSGQVAYVKMTRTGDNYFGTAKAYILGGQGSGATGTPTVQTVTGLSLLNEGRSYATPPTLIFEGGGGEGAQGAAEIDTLGKVSSISVVDSGEFYQEPPYILITGGGGIGAKATAEISQGEITAINVTEPGEGYTSPPNIIFTKLVNLKRKTRARQAFNSTTNYITGLLKNVEPDDTEIYVQSTDAFPGSGEIILNDETIAYTGRSRNRFTGLSRGVNFNYDQRVILDPNQVDQSGTSLYDFNVGDRVIRNVENKNNKVAKVYDWNPLTRELLVTFEVDELAFIDAGIASTEDAIVQFDAGVANSTGSSALPHVIEVAVGETIVTLTDPISTLQDRKFQDNIGDVDSDGNPIGDGIPDLFNTGTTYDNQINLDGGIYNSLYGIEETQGGQNTTLFAVGDNIGDASIPQLSATVVEAGGLSEGVDHTALVYLQLDANVSNGQNFSLNEVVTGSVSGITGTVVAWDAATSLLTLSSITPYNTGNVNIGVGGLLYEFSYNSTIVDFIIQDAGTNYSAVPTISIENTGDIQATGTAVMTTAGDQISSITITNGGYGIAQTVDGTYNLHPTVTVTNAVGDTTGSGAVIQAVLGGENAVGNGGASYRIKGVSYSSSIRS